MWHFFVKTKPARGPAWTAEDKPNWPRFYIHRPSHLWRGSNVIHKSTILWPQRGCNILMISPYFLTFLDSLAIRSFFMFSFHVSCVSFKWVFVLQSAPHWSHWDAYHLGAFLKWCLWWRKARKIALYWFNIQPTAGPGPCLPLCQTESEKLVS